MEKEWAGAQPGHYEVTVHRGDNGKTVSGPFTVGLLMNGSCISGSPQVTVTTAGGVPNYISFADLTIGGTKGPLCFTITNTGTGPLVLSSPSIIHCSDDVDPTYVDCSAVAGFAIVSGGSAVTLAPGESHDVCITFSPQKAATFDAHVVITTNAAGGPIDVPLHGTGDP